MQAITAQSCALVLVDYQSRLMPAIHDAERVAATAHLLARAARLLDLPVVGTEQNPAGLGATAEALRAVATHTVTKTHFDACADGLVEALDAATGGCRQVVLAGCESHVCLLQTALGLLRAGRQVWVVENACSSRRPADHAVAMQRLAAAGAVVVTHEMVMFEWLHDCRHPRFRDMLALVKSAPT